MKRLNGNILLGWEEVVVLRVVMANHGVTIDEIANHAICGSRRTFKRALRFLERHYMVLSRYTLACPTTYVLGVDRAVIERILQRSEDALITHEITCLQ